MSNATFMRAIRPVVGIAVLSALVALAIAGSTQAAGNARPGFYNWPEINPADMKVGTTLSGGTGALACDPECKEAGPNPDVAGIYWQWLSCNGVHGGGRQAPPGGLPDEGGPCDGWIIVKAKSKASGANTYTIQPADVGRYIQMEVIAINYDCGHPRTSDGGQECRYAEGHAWSASRGPVRALGPPPPPPPPPAVAPTYTALPAITGSAEDMQTLTVSNGTWNGTPTPTFTYQWLRCSKANNGCKAIESATQATYKVTTADIAARLTAQVKAENAGGSFVAAAPLTPKVTAARPRPGSDMLDVTQLLPRHHLKVQSVTFAPVVLRAGARSTATVTVTDARGFFIKGVEVTIQDELGDVTSVPALTNDRGVAKVRVRTTRFVAKGRTVLEVTATQPGDTGITATKRVTVVVR